MTFMVAKKLFSILTMESSIFFFLTVIAISLFKDTRQQEWITPSSIQTFPSLWNTNSNTNRAVNNQENKRSNQENTWNNQENTWRNQENTLNNQENTWSNQENTWNNEVSSTSSIRDTNDRLPRWNPVTDPPQMTQPMRKWNVERPRPWGRSQNSNSKSEVWGNKLPLQSDHWNYHSQKNYPRDNYQPLNNWDRESSSPQGWDFIKSQPSSKHRSRSPETSWQRNSNNNRQHDTWVNSNSAAVNRDRNVNKNIRFVDSFQRYHLRDKTTYQKHELHKSDPYIISSAPTLERYSQDSNQGRPVGHHRYDIRGPIKEGQYVHSPHSSDKTLHIQSNQYTVPPTPVKERYQRHQQHRTNSVRNIQNKPFQPNTDLLIYENSPPTRTSRYQSNDNQFPVHNREPERTRSFISQTKPRQNRQSNVIHSNVFDHTRSSQPFNVLQKSVKTDLKHQYVWPNKHDYINSGARQKFHNPPSSPDQQLTDLPMQQQADNHRYFKTNSHQRARQDRNVQADTTNKHGFEKSSIVHENQTPYNVGHVEQISPQYELFSLNDQRQNSNFQQDIQKIQTDIMRRTSNGATREVSQDRGIKEYTARAYDTPTGTNNYFSQMSSDSIPISPDQSTKYKKNVNQYRTDIFSSKGKANTEKFSQNPWNQIKQSKESFKKPTKSNDPGNLLQKLIRIKQLAESYLQTDNTRRSQIARSDLSPVSKDVYVKSKASYKNAHYQSSLPSGNPIPAIVAVEKKAKPSANPKPAIVPFEKKVKPSAPLEITPPQNGNSALPFSAFTFTDVEKHIRHKNNFDAPNTRVRRHHVVEEPPLSEKIKLKNTASRLNNRVNSPLDENRMYENNILNNNKAKILFDISKLGINSTMLNLNAVSSSSQTSNNKMNISRALHKSLTVPRFQKDSALTIFNINNTETPQAIPQTVIVRNQRESFSFKNNKEMPNFHANKVIAFQPTKNVMNKHARNLPSPQSQHPAQIHRQISQSVPISDISTNNSWERKTEHYKPNTPNYEVRYGQEKHVDLNLQDSKVSISQNVEVGNPATKLREKRIQQPQPLEKKYNTQPKAPDMRESFVPSFSKVSLQHPSQSNSPYISEPRSQGSPSQRQKLTKANKHSISQNYSNKNHDLTAQSRAQSTLTEEQNPLTPNPTSNKLFKHANIHHENIPQRKVISKNNRESDSRIMRNAFRSGSIVVQNDIPNNRIFRSDFDASSNTRQSPGLNLKFNTQFPNTYRDIVTQPTSHVPESLYSNNRQQSRITSAAPSRQDVETRRNSKLTGVASDAMEDDDRIVIQKRPQIRERIQNGQYTKRKIIQKISQPDHHSNQKSLHQDNYISGSYNPYSWESSSPQMDWMITKSPPIPVIQLIEPAFTKYKVRHADGATTKEQYRKVSPFVQRIVNYMYDADFKSYKVSDYLVMDRQSNMFALRSGKDTCYVGNLNPDIVNSFEEFALSTKSRNKQHQIVDGNPRLFFYIQMEQVKYRDVNGKAGKYIAGSCGTANKYTVKRLIQDPIHTSNGTTIPGDACPFGKPLRNPRSWHVTPCPMGYCPSLSHTCNIQYRICCPDMPKTTKCVSLSIGQLCVTASPKRYGHF